MVTISKQLREESMFSKIESLPSIILQETNFFEDVFNGFWSLTLWHLFDKRFRSSYFSVEFLCDVKETTKDKAFHDEIIQYLDLVKSKTCLLIYFDMIQSSWYFQFTLKLYSLETRRKLNVNKTFNLHQVSRGYLM